MRLSASNDGPDETYERESNFLRIFQKKEILRVQSCNFCLHQLAHVGAAGERQQVDALICEQ